MRRQRGHAMLELAASAAVMVSFLTGTVQFGYTFYAYNQLVTAVGNGARYASGRSYRPKDLEKGNTAIRNQVVYGDSQPDASAGPIVPGLKPENVEVKWTLGQDGAPEFVDISITHFEINAIFAKFTFAGRPSVEFPYLGRYAPGEMEP